MTRFNSIAFTALGLASLSKAQTDISASWPDWSLQTMTADYIPFVDDAATDVSSWFTYPATLLGASGIESTYGVSCYATETEECFGLEGWTYMTLVTSPKTMQIEFNEITEYDVLGCTLTGTPWPTTGTCSETYTSQNGSSVFTTSTSYTIPFVSTDTDIDFVESASIYTATMAVVVTAVTTNFFQGTLYTPVPASSTGGVVKSTGTGSGSGTIATGTAGTAKGSSTASHNLAMITGAPKWMLIAGAMAGAAVGV